MRADEKQNGKKKNKDVPKISSKILNKPGTKAASRCSMRVVSWLNNHNGCNGVMGSWGHGQTPKQTQKKKNRRKVLVDGQGKRRKQGEHTTSQQGRRRTTCRCSHKAHSPVGWHDENEFGACLLFNNNCHAQTKTKTYFASRLAGTNVGIGAFFDVLQMTLLLVLLRDFGLLGRGSLDVWALDCKG